MKHEERQLRAAIIGKCRWMNACGLNQGTSGNISARYQERMLITPSAVPYDAMEPEMIAAMPLDGEYGSWSGPLKPSTEWRFHLDILRARSDVGAIVHTHSTYATVLAIARKPIPACHYMIAAFGGDDIRCAGYARYGTKELSELALAALEGRNGCLLANHGMIAVGATLDKAMWLAVELETLARQYYLALGLGQPFILTKEEIAEVAVGFASYGLKDPEKQRRARKPRADQTSR
ncbi:MAG: class II aldolase/adducin family protein [Bradyrhizobium sp.]|uniref:class II aldolase/adducin family protein n=1 Tax=Bradyrhizobium sp. TaxID=376 RepID=UPI001D60AACA|nr:class II aldolase/adducin family protein [Bradyrhizobium sp.]MBV9563515.1 class II aldolase/adducin family protein [Bradyrhizobium sp.]